MTHPPTLVLNQHKYSTERQQNWQFSRPYHPFFSWRNLWMVPKAFQQREQRAKKVYSAAVLALCKPPVFDYSDVTMYEFDGSEDEQDQN